MANTETAHTVEGVQPSQSVAASAQQEALFAASEHTGKGRRTLGLRIVDNLIYSIANNISVFAVSVWLTYLSRHGGKTGADGKPLFGKFGKFIHERTAPINRGFRALGASEAQAKDFTTVFFSFADGTFFAPLIKLLEDRREDIALWIDTRFGTRHKDMSVYDAEPKQTWGSVVKGRLATSAIVVPTALVLDKTGLNEKMFTGLGGKLATFIENRPSLKKMFSEKLDMKEVAYVSVFEAFYTSVCTLGVYLFSRTFARHNMNKTSSPAIDRLKSQAEMVRKSAADDVPAVGDDTPPPPAQTKAETVNITSAAKREIPTTHVAKPHYAKRIEAPSAEQHVTA